MVRRRRRRRIRSVPAQFRSSHDFSFDKKQDFVCFVLALCDRAHSQPAIPAHCCVGVTRDSHSGCQHSMQSFLFIAITITMHMRWLGAYVIDVASSPRSPMKWHSCPFRLYAHILWTHFRTFLCNQKRCTWDAPLAWIDSWLRCVREVL